MSFKKYDLVWIKRVEGVEVETEGLDQDCLGVVHESRDGSCGVITERKQLMWWYDHKDLILLEHNRVDLYLRLEKRVPLKFSKDRDFILEDDIISDKAGSKVPFNDVDGEIIVYDNHLEVTTKNGDKVNLLGSWFEYDLIEANYRLRNELKELKSNQ